jgi:hypothetical protein
LIIRKFRNTSRKQKKGQLFSIDALVSFGVFLIILIIIFFMWNYSLNKTYDNDRKRETEQVSILVFEGLLKKQINSTFSNIISINDTTCKNNGMYRSTMHCFLEVTLENGTKYSSKKENESYKYTSTITRFKRLDNQNAIIILGISDE